MLSKEALNDFKQRYKEEFGIELDDKIVMEQANKFIMLCKAISRPIPINSPFIKRKEVKSEQSGHTSESEG